MCHPCICVLRELDSDGLGHFKFQRRPRQATHRPCKLFLHPSGYEKRIHTNSWIGGTKPLEPYQYLYLSLSQRLCGSRSLSSIRLRHGGKSESPLWTDWRRVNRTDRAKVPLPRSDRLDLRSKVARLGQALAKTVKFCKF